jgi:hypothetical protein
MIQRRQQPGFVDEAAQSLFVGGAVFSGAGADPGAVLAASRYGIGEEFLNRPLLLEDVVVGQIRQPEPPLSQQLNDFKLFQAVTGRQCLIGVGFGHRQRSLGHNPYIQR